MNRPLHSTAPTSAVLLVAAGLSVFACGGSTSTPTTTATVLVPSPTPTPIPLNLQGAWRMQVTASRACRFPFGGGPYTYDVDVTQSTSALAFQLRYACSSGQTIPSYSASVRASGGTVSVDELGLTDACTFGTRCGACSQRLSMSLQGPLSASSTQMTGTLAGQMHLVGLDPEDRYDIPCNAADHQVVITKK